MTSPPAAKQANSDPSEAPVSIKTDSITADRAILRLRPPRSLPPWIDSYEERYGPPPEDQLRLLNPPARIVQARHNVTPDEPQRRVSKDGFVEWDDPLLGPAKDKRAKIPHILRHGRASMRGRKWDHLRSSEPVIVAGYSPASTTKPSPTWHEFLNASAWGPMPNEDSEVVDYGVLKKLQPSFDRWGDVQLGLPVSKSSRRRKTVAFYKRLWITITWSSLSPLLFRLTVMITSILALGVASRIFQREDALDRDGAERTQAMFAVAVDCVAIPYIGYMVHDEYTGKPVGLRSGVSKTRLILLDVFFIIFKSASTALAFESIVYRRGVEPYVLQLSTVLGVFELVGLISWTMTFIVNVFRIVERLGGGADINGRLG